LVCLIQISTENHIGIVVKTGKQKVDFLNLSCKVKLSQVNYLELTLEVYNIQILCNHISLVHHPKESNVDQQNPINQHSFEDS